MKIVALAGGSLKVETLDVASYALISKNSAMPFFLLKNWYGRGYTGGAGPVLCSLVKYYQYSVCKLLLCSLVKYYRYCVCKLLLEILRTLS